jgi:hypothetical protein
VHTVSSCDAACLLRCAAESQTTAGVPWVVSFIGKIAADTHVTMTSKYLIAFFLSLISSSADLDESVKVRKKAVFSQYFLYIFFRYLVGSSKIR